MENRDERIQAADGRGLERDVSRQAARAATVLGFRKEILGSLVAGAGVGMLASLPFSGGAELLLGLLLVGGGAAVNLRLVTKAARRIADMEIDGGGK